MSYIATALGISPLAVLFLIAAGLLGYCGGLGTLMLLALIPDDLQRMQQQQKQTCQSPRPRKLKSPRRHKKETEQRAVRNAVLLVEGGTFQSPVRR